MEKEQGNPAGGRGKRNALRRTLKSLVDSALRKEAAGDGGDPFEYVNLEKLTPEEQESILSQGKAEVARRLRAEAEREGQYKRNGKGQRR